MCRPIPLLVLLVLLVLLAAMSGCLPVPAAPSSDGPLRVVVTVPPQAYVVERIAGPRAEVSVLMPPGSSGEIASPAPRQMVELTRAELAFLVGHPAFVYERRHVLPVLARHPQIAVVTLAGGRGGDLPEQVENRGELEEVHLHDHRGEADPHLWTSPRRVAEAAEVLAEELARLDPEGAQLYRRRLAAFRQEVRALDAGIRRDLEGAGRPTFLVYHPAWGHFAEEYGVEQMAIEEGGKEPSARRMVELIGEARREGIRVVVAQRGFPTRGARVVAEEVGARVVTLDPLARDWAGTLRRLARVLAEAADGG